MRKSDSSPEVRLFTAADLLAQGRSRNQIRTLIGRGILIPLARGVYVQIAVASEFRGIPNGDHVLRAGAALMDAGRGAAVSHQSAALVHGLDLIGKQPTVTITDSARGSRRGRTGLHLYSTALPPQHVTTKYGMPVTTVTRTVIDLARTLTFVDGVVAADSALRLKLTSKRELRSMLLQFPRWHGVAQAAEVVEFANRLAESALESIARVAFRDCGLPPPELQVDVGDDDGVIGRVDFLWREFRTIAEVDGTFKYENPMLARFQLRRDQRLRDTGFEVVHFGWREVTRTPDVVAASIRAAFVRGARPYGSPRSSAG